MTPRFHSVKSTRRFAVFFLLAWVGLWPVSAQASGQSSAANSECRVEAVDYKGWHGEQLSNQWVQLIVVPQNGGRLMQVTFGGHPYLFVNPKYAGKYLPPTTSQWFNYGGDKIWLLPEGNEDEQHWPGNSDVIDDGPYSFRKISEGKQCEIELTGPADPQTGIQIQRTIRLDTDSPRIRFHATMKNVTGHSLEWSMQSVSQYDTSDQNSANASASNASSANQSSSNQSSTNASSSASPSSSAGTSGVPGINHDFWTFTPANPSSSYLNRYHVRFGPAENREVSVRDDGLFTVHYMHVAAELWLDSTEGWVAVVNGSSSYAMVERFQYEEGKTYPGKASVIFWTNGTQMHVNKDGVVSLGPDSDAGPYYLEAELNSPMCRLRAGEACTFDTEWFPTRAGSEFHGATDSGIVIHPLQATLLENGKLKLSGAFGVFFSGRLVAHIYSEHGSSLGTMPVANVTPTEAVQLETEIAPPEKPGRLSLHLEDQNGVDRGSLQEVHVSGGDNH